MDELGRGATGVVYRAQDPAIGRVIAIKTIRLSDFTDENERERLRERLFREAQSAGMLSHPNIVTIYDIAEENGMAYIFMECVDGPPLEKALGGSEPVPNDVALSLLRQTATALDYAHTKGIVHRDIKPANILIHEGNHAKITDFGVAKIMSQQMTQSGVMMGTPNYMSPEQVQGHAVDGRTDEFSLAVIAYEILTGEKPFLAEHLPALLFRIVREDPVPPQRLNPTLGPQVESVLKKALAKNPSERYATCTEFVDALEAALRASPGWHALPRSSAQSMPTVMGAAMDLRPPGGLPPGAPEPAPLRRLEDSETGSPVIFGAEPARSTNRLLRSLVWMLVGVGLIGLVLYSAQKYLFNRNSEPAAEAQAPGEGAGNTGNTVKPSPVGQPPAEAANQAPAQQAPESTTPANQAPTATAPSASPAPPPAPASEPTTSNEETEARAARRERERPIPAPVIEPKSSAPQDVQFLTEPAGATVTVDGHPEMSCKTPCMLSLTGGRHSLTVELAGYRPYPRVFNVPADGDIFLKLSKATGTLSITSQPAGAVIDLDGKEQSQRTPAVFNLSPGNYHVKVARNGASIDFDVQLRDGEFLTKRVDF